MILYQKVHMENFSNTAFILCKLFQKKEVALEKPLQSS